MTSRKINSSPPKWANDFLEWYCKPEMLEQIQGDAFELFYKASNQKGKRIADFFFIWNVIRFFRWSNIKRSSKHSRTIIPTAMFKSYFISGIRSMIRNIIPSTINIAGLSVALACSITIFILIDSFFHLDTMHVKGDRIYFLMNKVKGGDEIEKWAASPSSLVRRYRPGIAVWSKPSAFSRFIMSASVVTIVSSRRKSGL
jgi:putative ABC transport system permease protein